VHNFWQDTGQGQSSRQINEQSRLALTLRTLDFCELSSFEREREREGEREREREREGERVFLHVHALQVRPPCSR